MKYLLYALCLGALVGCTRQPSLKDIRFYGEQRFTAEVLSVADGGQLPEEFLRVFHPLRVEPHLNGAWLVYKSSGRYEEGIYVDRISIEDWGGSGIEVKRWTKNIGWTKEKTRR